MSDTVVVLCGGVSPERHISRRGAVAIEAALADRRTPSVILDPAVDGDWLARIEASDCRCVFIVMHGEGGEDGGLQRELDAIGAAYTGSDAESSALAWDKIRCKHRWLELGLPTPEFVADPRAASTLSGCDELVLKPACSGSSLGVRMFSEASSLASMDLAQGMMVERRVRGDEYTVGVLGDRALPAVRVDTPREFYDYNAKYTDTATSYHCPCGLDDDEERDLQALALRAFKALGCEGWGRVDLIKEAGAGWQLLEVNTVPGMSERSLLPMAAAVAGLEFPALVMSIVAGARARGRTG